MTIKNKFLFLLVIGAIRPAKKKKRNVVRKMRNTFFIIMVSALVISSLSGCINNSLIGTYTHNNNSIKFQEDGTYLYTPAGGMAEKGTYTQNGTEIQVTNVLGITTILKKTSEGLLDDDGKTLWRKE
jgi:hypothetical protein